MSHNLIGVIVPVYKTEKYVAECIESILAQTYTNFRLILVDDGTPDNAGKICDEYAKKDSRITVIHQENAGVTRARAAGVEEAEDCEWITFVDSDDTIPSYALSSYVTNSVDADCVYGNITVFHKDLHQEKLYKTSGLVASSNIISSILKFERKFSWEICGKLFKKELLSKEVLDVDKNIKVYEDYIIILRILKRVKKVKIIKNITYNYIYRENSATSQSWCSYKYITNLSGIIVKEHSKDFPLETFKGKCQMLGWIINDKELNNKSEWFVQLLNECKNYKLGRLERVLIVIVRLCKNARIRVLLWNYVLKLKNINL